MSASDRNATDSGAQVPPFTLTDEQMEALRVTLTGLAAAMEPVMRAAAQWAESAAQRIAPTLETISRAMAEAAKTVLPALTYLSHLEQAKPPNWPSFLNYPRLHILARAGFPVVWVPGADVLTALMAVSTDAERSQVLVEHADEIIGHARTVLGDVTDPELADFAEVMRQALGCVREAYAPAQALSLQVATILALQETRMSKLADLRSHLQDLVVNPTTPVAPSDLRVVMTLVAVAPVVSQFFEFRGDPVPTTPNRHAVSHTVSPAQYTPANALWSVLIAMSVLRQAQENRQPLPNALAALLPAPSLLE